jgi:hypothetical protein
VSEKTTVHVALLGEGVRAWRPVAADHLGGDLYRLIDETPDDEVWAFTAGDIVRCQMRRLSGDYGKLSDVLVALEISN